MKKSNAAIIRELKATIKNRESQIDELRKFGDQLINESASLRNQNDHLQAKLLNANQVADIYKRDASKLEGGIVALNNLFFMMYEPKSDCESPHLRGYRNAPNIIRGQHTDGCPKIEF